MFAAILVHQMFEGLALGARVETLEFMAYMKKFLMGMIFSSACPIGMAIGIGVRRRFNGNQKSTVLVLGTLYALGAGVLAWVAFVVLWSADWLHGDLRMPGRKKGVVGIMSLLLGGHLTSVLAIWT
jgi:zinc transporter 1/2/3